MEEVTAKTDTVMQRSRQVRSGKRSADVSDEDTPINGTIYSTTQQTKNYNTLK